MTRTRPPRARRRSSTSLRIRLTAAGVLGLVLTTGQASLASPAYGVDRHADLTGGVITPSAERADPDAGLWVRNWTYGLAAGERQTATVYRDRSFRGRRPVVFFIHGGAWSIGNKTSMAEEARIWAHNGWVAVGLNYRLKVKGSQMISDVRTVVTHFSAASYADPAKVVLYGSSAGGHLATLIGAQRGLPGTPRVTGVIAWSPVASPFNQWRTGKSSTATAADTALGGKAAKYFGYDWVRTSALSYATRKRAPRMFLAGSEDDHVRWGPQGGALCEALKSRCTSSLLPGEAHGMGIPHASPQIAQAARDWAGDLVGLTTRAS